MLASTTVQGSPSDLRFYKVEEISIAEHDFANGILLRRLEKKIGLRENLEDAVDRTRMTERHFDKAKHLVLEITFTPMGVAYYTMTCQGPHNKFQPMLVKQSYGDVPEQSGKNMKNPGKNQKHSALFFFTTCIFMHGFNSSIYLYNVFGAGLGALGALGSFSTKLAQGGGAR